MSYFGGFAQTKWNGAPVKPGVILTGEKLVDDPAFRKKLVKLECEAIGGEMEAAGLYVSAYEQKVDWIVIKAICDFADGNRARTRTSGNNWLHLAPQSSSLKLSVTRH